MKRKLLIFLLLLTSLLGFLEWGGDHHGFLFELEAGLFKTIFKNPLAMLHPLILLPLAAQIILIVLLFKKPERILIYLSIGGIGLLMIMILLAGISSKNMKMVISTLPFILVALITLKEIKKEKQRL
jgi:hypothetical protein